MLDACNLLVKSFRTARERFSQGHRIVMMRLIGNRGFDPRTYNLPIIYEVIFVVVTGDLDKIVGVRDIVIETYSGKLQRINELNSSYLDL